ncbi:MAG: hypothetical protein IJ291_05590 [Lachnospiraceae bacterium]|nr:hypothetical protein [Lachnospiraceae bacterium]
MKDKLCQYARPVLVSLFVAGFALQVVFAGYWAFTNGNNVQEFYDTSFYLKSAGMYGLDAWHLPGYVMVINIAQTVFGFLGDGYVWGVYLFQTLFSLFIFTEAIRSLGLHFFKKEIPYKVAVLFGLYIVTVPIIWQMQFALLPDAICLAASCILFAKSLELTADRAKFRWDCLYVIAGGLLVTATYDRYAFYGAFLWSLFCCIYVFADRFMIHPNSKRKLGTAGCIPVLLLLACVIHVLYPGAVKSEVNQATGLQGVVANSVSYSPEADLMHRFTLYEQKEASAFYGEVLQKYFDDGYFAEYEDTQEGLFYVAAPLMEKELGSREAKKLFMEMNLTGFRQNWTGHLVQMWKEVTGYVFMPVSAVKYMYNAANSKYGYNYTRMWEREPVLTRDYMHTGMNGVLIFTLAAVTIALIGGIKNKKKGKKILFSAVTGLGAILVFTLPAMIFDTMCYDYRIGLFSLCLWLFASILTMTGLLKKGDLKNG